MKNIHTSIIIPVYNSSKTIAQVVNILHEIMQNINYEIILINDGSIDNSFEICTSLVKDSSRVKFINLSRNFGQHNALLAGYNLASGKYILSMDDDLQTDPNEVLNLLNHIESSDCDVVFASYKEKKHSTFRNFGSWLNGQMMQKFVKKPKDLKITSFFVMKSYIKNEIIKYQGPYPYLAGLILRTTNNIENIEIEHKDRQHGESNYTLSKLISLTLDGFTNFSILPLRIAGISGFVCCIISIIASIYILINKLVFDGYSISGWTSMILLLVFSAGIQLLFLGLIGEYLGRTFLLLNKHPQFIIKEIIENSQKNDKGIKNDTI